MKAKTRKTEIAVHKSEVALLSNEIKTDNIVEVGTDKAK